MSEPKPMPTRARAGEPTAAERLAQFLANPALLARLAREAEGGDPINWGELTLDHGAAYELMASQIADMFRGYARQGLDADEQLLLALGTIVKLATESFVLNQRLMGAGAR